MAECSHAVSTRGYSDDKAQSLAETARFLVGHKLPLQATPLEIWDASARGDYSHACLFLILR